MSFWTAEDSVKLDDLPDELVLLIFDDADVASEDLYFLAQVSKRLHNLCLSILYPRFNLKSGDKKPKVVLSDKPYRVDALSLLRISIHVTTLDRLVLKFPVCQEQMGTLIRCVERSASLLSRLESVNKVVLVFSNDVCFCCDADGIKAKSERSVLKAWSVAMGRLLDSIVEASCTSLVLKGGRYFGHIFSFRRKPNQSGKLLNSGAIEAVKTFFTTGSKSGEVIEDKRPPRVNKGDTWEFKRAEKAKFPLVLTDVSPVAKERSKLKSITIQAMMFLMPPLLQWVISAMHHSPIETLILGNLSINYKCWPAIFDLLQHAAPDLTEIKICKLRQIEPVDLLKFLGSFPKLTSLTVSHEVENYDAYNVGPFPDFPKLISLHAPASWVSKLLSSHPRGLECLESLSITYKLRNDGLSHWLRQCPNPSIPTLLNDQLRPLTLCLEVRLGESPAWKMFEDLNVELSDAHKEYLELITSITLLVEDEFAKSDMPLTTVLPRWLALFPALRFVTLTGHNSFIDGGDMFEKLIEIVKANPKMLQLYCLNVNGKEAEFVRNPKKGPTPSAANSL